MSLKLQRRTSGSAVEVEKKATRSEEKGSGSRQRLAPGSPSRQLAERERTVLDPAAPSAMGSAQAICTSSDRELLDYIAALSGELRRLAERAGQSRLSAALQVAEQEARLQLLGLTIPLAHRPKSEN